MRFSSGSFMVVFGLVAATCAAPVNGDYDMRDLESVERYEARDLDKLFFPRSESEGLEIRAVKFADTDYNKELAITYDTPKIRSSGAPPSVSEVAKMVENFLTDAHVLKLHDPKVKPTNQWKGNLSLVMFKFSLPVCKGDCHAKVFFDGKGELTNGEGKVIYTAKHSNGHETDDEASSDEEK